MKNHFHFLSLFQIAFFSSLLVLISFFKVSHLVGSQHAFISLSDCLISISGSFIGLFGLFILTFIRGAVTAHGSFFFSHFPSLFGGLAWARPTVLLRVLVPALCMGLFWAHPTGAAAGVYAFFWLIPIVIHLRGISGLIAHAYASTFVVHAVGSVTWLYTHTMSAEQWVALMPLVVIERSVLAGGAVVGYYLFQSILTLAQKRAFPKWLTPLLGA